MYDLNLAVHVLEQIHTSTQTILSRFEPVQSVNYFTDSPTGMEKLDSICMQLIALGESLKNLDKITSGELLKKYPQVDWRKATARPNFMKTAARIVDNIQILINIPKQTTLQIS